MLRSMTSYLIAAVALGTLYMIILGGTALQRERRRIQLVIAEWSPDQPVIALAHPFTDEPDDGSNGDPTWYPRALAFGHDPDLSAADRRALAPLFECFDRLMTDAFHRLDTVGV